MPIYEYKCAECGAHLEKMQKVSDATLTVCEKCGGKLEKQWSLSGFQFKGEGWYVTDYAGKKESNNGKSDAKTETKTEKSSAGESTASADSASNTKSDSSTTAKPDSVSKKD